MISPEAVAMEQPEDRLDEIRERLACVPDPLAMLEGIFAFSPMALQIYRADGHCLLTNRAFRELFGSEPPPEYCIFKDEIAEAQGVLGLIRRAFAGETITLPTVWYDPRELRQVKVTTGRRCAMQSTFFPLRGRSGQVEYVAIVFKDVTAEMLAREEAEAGRRAAEAAARQAEEARAQAERASRAKDEFLAMLGHELRNPLAPIVTALELMRQRASDETRRERAVIQRQVQHLVRLVDDLLDVSRITQGKITLKREPIELAQVVAKAVEMVSPLLEERAQHLTVSLPAGGLLLLADPLRLAQVVANLLTHAAKYTEPGGRITVDGERQGERIVLRVRDTGIGIAPELLPRLFGLFVQGERGLARSQGGLGLGLTIVRSLVELHGGQVHAHSEGPGRGSEFIVELPAPPGEEGEAGSARSTASLPRPAAEPGGCRVLVVDDNRDAAELLAEALSAMGYTTRVAYDGPGALAEAAAFRPEVAILDIGLPVMDGYELARRLREQPGLADLKLVAVTGYGQDTDRALSLEAGFAEHLVKPIDLEQVRALLRQLAPTSA
jgi:signal transduction histidine kinase